MTRGVKESSQPIYCCWNQDKKVSKDGMVNNDEYCKEAEDNLKLVYNINPSTEERSLLNKKYS